MSATSANPVERAQAELEAAMAEFNQLVEGDNPGQGNDSEPLVDDLYDTQHDQQQSQQQQSQQQSQDSNSDSYKQKWQSLQGIVRSKDSQIETLTSQIQTLMEQNQTIMAQMQSAGNTSGQSDQQAGDLSVEDLDGVAAAVRDKFGDELGDVFAKFANHVKTIESRVKPIEEKTRRMDAREAETQAEMKLTQLCPNWKKLDSDKNFIKWLDRKAPYTNKKLVDVLNDSYRTGDIETTAAIFNEYNELTRNAASDPRDGMITPDSRGTAGFQSDTNQQQKVWREKDAAQFFRDVQTGKYRGREADAQRIEAEISQAYLEGRVR